MRPIQRTGRTLPDRVSTPSPTHNPSTATGPFGVASRVPAAKQGTLTFEAYPQEQPVISGGVLPGITRFRAGETLVWTSSASASENEPV